MTASVAREKSPSQYIPPWMLLHGSEDNHRKHYDFDPLSSVEILTQYQLVHNNIPKRKPPSPSLNSHLLIRSTTAIKSQNNGGEHSPSRKHNPPIQSLSYGVSDPSKPNENIKSRFAVQQVGQNIPSACDNIMGCLETPESKQKQVEKAEKTREFLLDNCESTGSSNELCSGLRNYIRRKNKKQFICDRCGLTHSNYVKANSQIVGSNDLNKVRNSRARRSGRKSKEIIICPNCGKRSHNTALVDGRTKSPDLFRSMTWPPLLERIEENEKEVDADRIRPCLVERSSSLPECLTQSEMENGKVISTSPESTNSTKSILDRLFKANEGRSIKVLVALPRRLAKETVNFLKRYAAKEHTAICFVAMVPAFLEDNSSDICNCREASTSHEVNDIYYDAEVVSKMAKVKDAKIVLIGHIAEGDLIKVLTTAGYYVLQPHVTDNMDNRIILSREGGERTPDIRVHSPLSHVPSNQYQATNDSQLEHSFPDTPVLCASVFLAHKHFEKRQRVYKDSLERGEILPSSHLSTVDEIELVHNNNKYCVKATKTSPSSYYLQVCNSNIAVHVSRSSCEGLQLTLGGTTHHTFVSEETDRFHVTVDDEDYFFDKDITFNSCQQYDDGAGKKFQPPPIALKSQLVDSTQSSLNDVTSSMNPTSSTAEVQNKEMNNNGLEITNPASSRNTVENLSEMLKCTRDQLHLIMKGWCSPRELFEVDTTESVKKFMEILNNPSLPLQELKESLVRVSTRLPSIVYQRICKEVSRYASNITSMMTSFPGDRIRRILEAYSNSLNEKSLKESFWTTAKPISDIIERYCGGIRGSMISEVSLLIQKYHHVEKLFQNPSMEDDIIAMLDENRDVDSIHDYLFSHDHVTQKNFLLLQVFKYFSTYDHQLPGEFLSLLEDVGDLMSESCAPASLTARRLLKNCRKTPYDLRYNQMNSLFLSLPPSDSLINSICESDLLQVLPQYFCTTNMEVRMASLEIFIRRLYASCQLDSVQQHQVGSEYSAILYRHPPDNTIMNKEELPDNGTSDDDHVSILTAFPDLTTLDQHFAQVVELFESNVNMNDCSCNLDHLIFDQPNERLQSTNNSDVDCSLNVAIVTTDDVPDDDTLGLLLIGFLRNREERLRAANIKRVTFLVHRRLDDMKYFTYAFNSDQLCEDISLRHIHPALSPQFHLNLVEDCSLVPLPSSMYHLHLYQGLVNEEDRLFIRTVFYEEDNKVDVGCVRSNLELLFLESMDELSRIPDEDRKSTNIFINYLSILSSQRADLENEVNLAILRFESRMRRRKLGEVEVMFHIRSDEGAVSSCHLHFIVNETCSSLHSS